MTAVAAPFVTAPPPSGPSLRAAICGLQPSRSSVPARIDGHGAAGGQGVLRAQLERAAFDVRPAAIGVVAAEHERAGAGDDDGNRAGGDRKGRRYIGDGNGGKGDSPSFVGRNLGQSPGGGRSLGQSPGRRIRDRHRRADRQVGGPEPWNVSAFATPSSSYMKTGANVPVRLSSVTCAVWPSPASL